jgi:hypothetical protein
MSDSKSADEIKLGLEAIIMQTPWALIQNLAPEEHFRSGYYSGYDSRDSEIASRSQKNEQLKDKNEA